MHSLFGRSHADVNQVQVRRVSNGSLTMIDNDPELACTQSFNFQSQSELSEAVRYE
jgi:hypothetical protein